MRRFYIYICVSYLHVIKAIATGPNCVRNPWRPFVLIIIAIVIIDKRCHLGEALNPRRPDSLNPPLEFGAGVTKLCISFLLVASREQ